MTEHPILFTGPMVRAILEGRKTQTRRVVKPQPSEDWEPSSYGEVHNLVNGHPDPDKVIGWGPSNEDGTEAYACPYGKPGDRLWVRETWRPLYDGESGYIDYKAGGTLEANDEATHKRIICQRRARRNSMEVDNGYRPSIHMPRWASRLNLLIKSLRVERVQDISEGDIEAEGVDPQWDLVRWGAQARPRFRFKHLWDSINGKRPGCTWADNPWVWVIGFERTTNNQGATS